jgi:hypothetical protein
MARRLSLVARRDQELENLKAAAGWVASIELTFTPPLAKEQ